MGERSNEDRKMRRVDGLKKERFLFSSQWGRKRRNHADRKVCEL